MFKAHRLVYHSILGSEVIKKYGEEDRELALGFQSHPDECLC